MREDNLVIAYWFTSFAANLLKVNPTAIGRIPPHFLLSATNRPPKKIGRTASGTPPPKIKFTRAVNATSSGLGSPSATTMSLRCCAVSPSGPPDEPAGNEYKARRTAASSMNRGGHVESGGGAGRRSDGADGCLSGEAG